METLSHYGALLVGGDENCRVTFQMPTKWEGVSWLFNRLAGRQRMDDRTYSEDFFTKWVNRSGGGPNLEWVDSPNLDCPLSR